MYGVPSHWLEVQLKAEQSTYRELWSCGVGDSKETWDWRKLNDFGVFNQHQSLHLLDVRFHTTQSKEIKVKATIALWIVLETPLHPLHFIQRIFVFTAFFVTGPRTHCFFTLSVASTKEWLTRTSNSVVDPITTSRVELIYSVTWDNKKLMAE